jgi:epoxyqueuosine reductase
MKASPEELGREALALCRAEGFALAGICAAEASARGEELRAWLAAGRHGSMEWLARNVEERIDPRVMVEGARSLIVVADQYAAPDGGKDGEGERSATFGRIARYARGDDYHTVMKKRLHRLCDALRRKLAEGDTLRAFVDTAPVLEREHAARAGLGWIGKHTLLIHPERGSYLLLGGVITTAELRAPTEQRIVEDHCGTCTRCIDACPTGAIAPYSVDATRCVSYLTIERREAIDPALHAGTGSWLFGCDVCQEVCPHNREREYGERIEAHGAYAARRRGFDAREVLGWTEEDRRREFEGSALKRARLEMMHRNARIVVENGARNEQNVPGEVRKAY